jgi:hypothetical protein
MRAQPEIDISARPVPEEPLYIIINHAISYSFTSIDWENLLPCAAPFSVCPLPRNILADDLRLVALLPPTHRLL